MLRYRMLETPTGPFAIAVQSDGSYRTGWIQQGDIGFDGSDVDWPARGERDDSIEPDLAARLTRYFDGEDVRFDDLPLPPGPPFFSRCWEACRSVPRGETLTYAELARASGSPKAIRAAGQAMRRNPVPIIVPCHRVVATSGGLGGFAGNHDPDSTNLGVKRYLLRLEAAAGKADS